MQKTPRLVGRFGLACSLALCLIVPAFYSLEAMAQEAQPELAEPAASEGATVNAVPQAKKEWGDEKPPEGFVKGKEPVKGKSAYNWVQMGYASLVMLAMVLFMVWLVRSKGRDQL